MTKAPSTFKPIDCTFFGIQKILVFKARRLLDRVNMNPKQKEVKVRVENLQMQDEKHIDQEVFLANQHLKGVH